MEETGILENPALLSLVLPDFEPGRLSHALPTSDPDLACIVGLWDRLADQIKARLLDVIRENLPT